MPITKFTNLDFDQIRTQIKDYLRSNSDFSDFDFDGSNFSVLIDTLAYNTYITAFNSNMIVNESFLDSATLRENVVSLARNIGYTPRSKTSARAEVAFKLKLPSSNPPDTVELRRGLVCVGAVNDSSYTFAISENVTKQVVNEEMHRIQVMLQILKIYQLNKEHLSQSSLSLIIHWIRNLY